MESRLVTPLLILATGLLAAPVQAAPPARPPQAGPPTHEMRSEERGRKRFMPPFKPFLMAGQPEFARMIEAALATEAELEQKLDAWPRYQELDEAAKRDMRNGFERFRRRIREEAMDEATQRGWTIPPGQESAYLRSYWSRRIQIETQIRARAEEQWKSSMEQAMAEVGRAYGGGK